MIIPARQGPIHLATVFKTPITAEPSALLTLFTFWGGGIWLAGYLRPKRSWAARAGTGTLYALMLLLADAIHYLGHIFSAHYAGAPMNAIRFAFPLPRSVYLNQDVSPQAHRTRAWGGPIYNGLICLIELLSRPWLSRHALVGELNDVGAAFNGLFCLGGLLPIPFVDGGSILKWTLVERGHSPAEADELVQQVNFVTGATAAGVATAMAAQKHWVVALGLAVTSAVCLAVGLGKLKEL